MAPSSPKPRKAAVSKWALLWGTFLGAAVVITTLEATGGLLHHAEGLGRPGGSRSVRPFGWSEVKLAPQERVAVCITGSARFLDITAPGLLKYLGKGYPKADLFLALTADEHAYKVLALKGRHVAVVSMLAGGVPARDAELLARVLGGPAPGSRDLAAAARTAAAATRAYLAEECGKLVTATELVAGVRYAWFVLAGADQLYFHSPPQLAALDPARLTVPLLSPARGFSDVAAVGGAGARTALARRSMAAALDSAGVRAEGPEHALRHMLVRAKAAVGYAEFPMCQLVGPGPYNESLEPVVPVGSGAAHNGALCRPCTVGARGADAWRALSRLPGLWGWVPARGAAPLDLELCNPAEAEWPAATWRTQLDAALGRSLAGTRAALAARLQDLPLEECLQELAGLRGIVGVWQGASLKHVCTRARLGPVEYVGTDYGGWNMFQTGLSNSSLVYAFGVGTDISWDKEIIRRYGLSVHAFDNTPVSMTWLRTQRTPARWHHHKFLLGGTDGELEMAMPKGHYMSFSTTDAQAFGFRDDVKSVKLPCRKLETLMASLGHSKVDVLKLDIEGAEFNIFDQWATERNAPAVCQILVEFHARLMPDGEARRKQAISGLESIGFVLASCTSDSFGSDDCLFFSLTHCHV